MHFDEKLNDFRLQKVNSAAAEQAYIKIISSEQDTEEGMKAQEKSAYALGQLYDRIVFFVNHKFICAILAEQTKRGLLNLPFVGPRSIPTRLEYRCLACDHYVPFDQVGGRVFPNLNTYILMPLAFIIIFHYSKIIVFIFVYRVFLFLSPIH